MCLDLKKKNDFISKLQFPGFVPEAGVCAFPVALNTSQGLRHACALVLVCLSLVSGSPQAESTVSLVVSEWRLEGEDVRLRSRGWRLAVRNDSSWA